MRDYAEKFSMPTVWLHWIIAIGMISMLAFGLYIEDQPRSPDKGQLIGLHKSFGLIIFVIAVTRISWRYKNKFPKPLSLMPPRQRKLVKFTHWVLIVGTVLMPISGILMSVGGGHSVGLFGLELVSGSGVKTEFMEELGHIIHSLGSKILIFFILLHIAGAVKHQFFDKDGTISRMLGKHIK